MPLKPFYRMLPGEIIKARDISGCAFIPVGPLEWHSYHLPIGTDALIAEKICQLVAEKVDGVYFKPLLFGTDELRKKGDLRKWGFDDNDRIFGMNFPDLPLKSEYCTKEDLITNVERRIRFLNGCRFKYTFVVNHHGGKGQNKYLKAICKKHSSKGYKVEFVSSYRFLTLKESTLCPDHGGHSGISETTFLIAFYPELVDLSKIDKGELEVRKTGILHHKPVMGKEHNPRNVSRVLADKLRENIISNFTDYIKEKYL